MNLHEASRRYAESRSEKKDERKTTTLDSARLLGAEAIERTLSLRKCFPLGGFQLENRTRMTVGLGRRGRTRIWRSM